MLKEKSLRLWNLGDDENRGMTSTLSKTQDSQSQLIIYSATVICFFASSLSPRVSHEKSKIYPELDKRPAQLSLHTRLHQKLPTHHVSEQSPNGENYMNPGSGLD